MAGAGYKLFNTGDVLTAAQVNTYLMEQTVMVFADATARTTALSGVVAEGMLSYLKSTKQVEVYNGSAWVASDDPNAIQNTIVDAKGDLITATAADTPARLAVGNPGETVVADSSATTGLRWQGNFAAGKNAIINGDFRINQRAFTSNTASGSFNFDRFFQLHGGTSGTLTVTPQTFTAGTAPVAGYEAVNFVRCVTASGASANTYALLEQKIEDVRTFANQTMTVSFWAKAGSGTPNISVEIEQNFGSGGSATVFTAATKQAISTSWARYSFTITVPSISGKTIGTGSATIVGIWLSAGSDFNTRSNTVGLQNGTFDIWGVQAEIGSVATAFQTATGTLAGELAACQRYYYLFASGSDQSVGLGSMDGTTFLQTWVPFQVTMRIAPSLVATSGTNYYRFQRNGASDNFNSWTILRATQNGSGLYNNSEISGTSGDSGFIDIINSLGSIAFNAEL